MRKTSCISLHMNGRARETCLRSNTTREYVPYVNVSFTVVRTQRMLVRQRRVWILRRRDRREALSLPAMPVSAWRTLAMGRHLPQGAFPRASVLMLVAKASRRHLSVWSQR